jgi:hypothetical protein
MVGQFRKKPTIVDAVRYAGVVDARTKAYEQVLGRFLEIRTVENVLCLIVPTLRGDKAARPGDWIVRGVRGELDAVDAETFRATYEPVYAPDSPDALIPERHAALD